jgi:hypothetical protein
MTEQEIIDEIFRIRVINNNPWKRLIEIGLEYAPVETRRALAQISDNDERISDLTRMLAQ